MNTEDQDFYKNASKKYKQYSFHPDHQLVDGIKPNFIDLLKKYSGNDIVAVDLGCGSGEFTFASSKHFNKILGIDPFKDYIDTAIKNNKSDNIEYLVAEAESLPFEDNSIDLIYSSRGPLSANIEIMTESHRVLKSGGLMIEETIGENDKLEVKDVFKRGQNYPPKSKIGKVKELLDVLNMELVEHTYYIYYNEFASFNEVIETLEHAPIIPDFDKEKDAEALLQLEKKLKANNYKLSSHRLHWVARKI